MKILHNDADCRLIVKVSSPKTVGLLFESVYGEDVNREYDVDRWFNGSFNLREVESEIVQDLTWWGIPEPEYILDKIQDFVFDTF